MQEYEEYEEYEQRSRKRGCCFPLSVVSGTMSWLIAGFRVSNCQNVPPILHRLHLEQPLMQESMPAGTIVVDFDGVVGCASQLAVHLR